MKAIWTLLALAVIVVAAALFCVDRLLVAAVERGGSYALGVDTELDSARLGLLSGKLGLSGLRVSNPEGFEIPHFLSLGRADVHVRLPSLTRDPVVVSLVSLRDLELSLERTKGRTNSGVILDNLGKLESGESPTAPKEEEAGKEGSKGFVIHELVIREVTAHARLSAVGTKLTEADVTVPEIKLHDIGSGSASGIPLTDLVDIVTKAVLHAVAEQRGGLPLALRQELRGQLGRLERVKMELPRSVDELTKGELATEAQKQLGDAASKGAELLKGLGGRKEKSQD